MQLAIVFSIIVKKVHIHFVEIKQKVKNRRIIADFVLFSASAWSIYIRLSAEAEKFHLTFSTSASV